MFNALNRFISRLDGDEKQQAQQAAAAAAGYGFQILRNTNTEIAIDPWFDFIVGINGRVIDNPSPALFAQEVRNCAGGTVTLGLWNAKGQRTRTLYLPIPPTPSSPLGLSLQWSPLSLASTIWHVLDVPANSPADLAGLLPYSDYILGSPEGTLHGESGLGELVEDFIGRSLRLWVYNNEYDVTREVVVTPGRSWGGEGALGCVLGFGALHRLPPPLSEPVDAPGGVLFDGNEKTTPQQQQQQQQQDGFGFGGYGVGIQGVAPNLASPADVYGQQPPLPMTGGGGGGGDFLVPADMASTLAPPSQGTPGTANIPTRSARKKETKAHTPGTTSAMDDYFNEQEKKSRELEGNAASRSASPLPPPPKAGGPPMGGPPKAVTPQQLGDDSGGAGA